ncbi:MULTISPECIES: chorismate mutase [unclassified Streptomyces]|jgi:chorismate mutase|uniref:chorismate mutase n=1 Tax=unclassified Streptomyces TaxID=2593676 RepID=UPI00081B73EF|nr:MULTISPECIES: chorismate mutase [unclassified Streptomyces]SCD96561.1 chorismate mutase [Streptomyces sp. DvalAA-43]
MSGTRAAEALHTRIARGRERLGALDTELIHLIRTRARAAHELEELRRKAGGPRTDLTGENAMLRGYHGALGRRGTSIALLLLELGRAEGAADGR